MIRIVLAATVGLTLAGCSNKPVVIGGASDLQVIEGNLPAPDGQDTYVVQDTYLVGPADVLRIDVVGMPDISNRSIRVDQGGRISFPLAGTLEVAGKTTAEVAEMITQGMQRNHVREPQVAVNLETQASRSITVFGQVREPGVFPLAGKTTLLRAIALAKGFDEFGRQDDVVVFRTVGGQRMATLYNVAAIRRGYYADPDIYANDLVVVGDNAAKRLFRDLVSAATIVTTPLTVLLQNSN